MSLLGIVFKKQKEPENKDIKSEVFKFPMINDFQNIYDKNKELLPEQLLKLNQLKQIQLQKNYGLRLMYRAKLLDQKKKQYSQDSQFKSLVDDQKSSRSQIYIDFFKNDFVDYNLFKNRIENISLQNIKMKNRQFRLDVERNSALPSLS